MKKKCIALVLLTVLFGALAWKVLRPRINPFPDVVFLREDSGHTSSYHAFKPVLAKDHSVVLGPSHSAQDGVLRFYDWDGDGAKDAVVETPDTWFDFGEYRTPSRHVWRYEWDATANRPALKSIFSGKGESSEAILLKDDS